MNATPTPQAPVVDLLERGERRLEITIEDKVDPPLRLRDKKQPQLVGRINLTASKQVTLNAQQCVLRHRCVAPRCQQNSE